MRHIQSRIYSTSFIVIKEYKPSIPQCIAGLPLKETGAVSSITNRAISGRNSVSLYSTHAPPCSPLQRLEVHTHCGSTHYLAAWMPDPHSPRSHTQIHVRAHTRRHQHNASPPSLFNPLCLRGAWHIFLFHKMQHAGWIIRDPDFDRYLSDEIL